MKRAAGKIAQIFRGKKKVISFDPFQTESPPLVTKTLEWLHAHSLKTDGLFRICGTYTTVNDYKVKFDKGKEVVLDANLDPHIVSGILKLWLCELPNPLFTFELYDSFIAAGETENADLRLYRISEVLRLLPPANKIITMLIIDLMTKIDEQKHLNHMPASNLAIIFASVLLRSKDADLQQLLDDSQTANNLLLSCILHRDKLFDEGQRPGGLISLRKKASPSPQDEENFNAVLLKSRTKLAASLIAYEQYYAHEALAAEEARKERIAAKISTLQSTLKIPLAQDYLKQYLTQEFSEENLMFWMDVERYKRTLPLERLEKAKEIYSIYIAEDSVLQVNIDSDCHDVITEVLIGRNEASPYLFDDAQQWVQRLMESHSFPRFVKSNKWKTLLERLIEIGEDEIDTIIEEEERFKKSEEDKVRAEEIAYQEKFKKNLEDKKLHELEEIHKKEEEDRKRSDKKRKEEDDRKRSEDDELFRLEEELKQLQLEEDMRIQEDQERKVRLEKLKEEERRRIEEEQKEDNARRLREEAEIEERSRLDEQARRQAEEDAEAKRRRDEEQRIKEREEKFKNDQRVLEEQRRQMDEARRFKEEQDLLLLQEDERLKQEQVQRQKEYEIKQRQIEEERKRLEEEQRKFEQEKQERFREEEERRLKWEQERKQKEEEERLKREEDQRIRRIQEEERRAKENEERKRREEARIQQEKTKREAEEKERIEKDEKEKKKREEKRRKLEKELEERKRKEEEERRKVEQQETERRAKKEKRKDERSKEMQRLEEKERARLGISLSDLWQERLKLIVANAKVLDQTSTMAINSKTQFTRDHYVAALDKLSQETKMAITMVNNEDLSKQIANDILGLAKTGVLFLKTVEANQYPYEPHIANQLKQIREDLCRKYLTHLLASLKRVSDLNALRPPPADLQSKAGVFGISAHMNIPTNNTNRPTSQMYTPAQVQHHNQRQTALRPKSDMIHPSQLASGAALTPEEVQRKKEFMLSLFLSADGKKVDEQEIRNELNRATQHSQQTQLARTENGEIVKKEIVQIVYEDQSQYEGEVAGDKCHGRGKYTFPTGNVYEGDFKDGRIEGVGTLIYAKGDKYEGEFKNDKRDGKGRYTAANGDIYIGQYIEGKRHGKGTYKMSSGASYEGEYANGLPSFGVYTFENGDKYEGPFVNDSFEGKGKFIGVNGVKYEGDYIKGKKHGKGAYVTAKGDVYVGDFQNDCMCGRGVYTYAHKDRYEGEFASNRFNGQGTYYFTNGNQFEGVFKDGRPVQQ
eukprot:TRINITY_DN4830_c0_g1_i1.p1 TRINITY_DN4830_c0_g1~~TRINITY_DN4830_c0_g1_i1.p1  ORF type:complete len:1266 (-),score=654.53 TRINITY_DN4830_c0_g1_i1:91-3888(-)